MKYLELIEQLKSDEGLRLNAYRCTAGKLTIGYGHNLEVRPYFKGELIPMTIDIDLANQLLENDIEKTEKALETAYKNYHHLSPARQDALINMGFQIGVRGLMGFKRMLIALDVGNFDKAYAEAMDSDWAKQTPARANRVARQLMYGEYQC